MGLWVLFIYLVGNVLLWGSSLLQVKGLRKISFCLSKHLSFLMGNPFLSLGVGEGIRKSIEPKRLWGSEGFCNDVFGRFGDTNLNADESDDLRASVKNDPQVGEGGTQGERERQGESRIKFCLVLTWRSDDHNDCENVVLLLERVRARLETWTTYLIGLEIFGADSITEAGDPDVLGFDSWKSIRAQNKRSLNLQMSLIPPRSELLHHFFFFFIT